MTRRSFGNAQGGTDQGANGQHIDFEEKQLF